MTIRFIILFLILTINGKAQINSADIPDSLIYSKFTGRIISQDLSGNGMYELLIKNDSLHEQKIIYSDARITRKQLKWMKEVDLVYVYSTWINVNRDKKRFILQEIRTPNTQDKVSK